MALELVTGYWGQNHVTAEQEADLNAGIFGSGFYVLPVGEKMRAEAVTSNQVRIFDGIFVGYGRQASIEEGGYENVTIENGTAGLLRNDMIVVKYTKDEESGVEGVTFEVLKGQTGESAQDPVPNNQDIRAGAFESEMPLYRVKLNGLAIEAIEPLFTVPKSIPELMQDISDLEDANDALNSALADMGTGFGAIIASQRTIPVSTSPAITEYETKEWDDKNAFDSSTGYFAVPIHGIWKFSILASFNTRENVKFSIGFFCASNNSWHFPQTLKIGEETVGEASLNASIEFSLPKDATVCAVLTANDNSNIELTAARFTGELIRSL